MLYASVGHGGASGDLAGRLLLPALFHLERTGRLPALAIVGFSIEKWRTDEFQAHVRNRLQQFAPGFTDAIWQRFVKRLAYVSGDFSPQGTADLARAISGQPLAKAS